MRFLIIISLISVLASKVSSGEAELLSDLVGTEGRIFCDSSALLAFDLSSKSFNLASESPRKLEFLSDGSRQKIVVDYKPLRQNWRVATISIFDLKGRPYAQARLSRKCKISRIRRLAYDLNGRVRVIQNLDLNSLQVVKEEQQNPDFQINLDGYRKGNTSTIVALVDTGVNYTLPEFREYLAVDEKGELLGYDFWDDDDRPFDKDPRANPFFPLHHGSTVFSVLARELGSGAIAVYRFPALEVCKFEQLLDHIEKNAIRVVSMSMGSKKESDWQCFLTKAAKMDEVLFVVSAGNDDRNIDEAPIFPASSDLSNILVVTSSDYFGRLGPGSNFGKQSVDIMVPAERIEILDHRGNKNNASGTSYAAPRVAALVSRYIQSNPSAKLAEIIDFLKGRAIPSGLDIVKFGWIPDPTDNYGF